VQVRTHLGRVGDDFYFASSGQCNGSVTLLPTVVSRPSDIRCPIRVRGLLVVAAILLFCHGGLLSPLSPNSVRQLWRRVWLPPRRNCP
jgi:hypothetical protein